MKKFLFFLLLIISCHPDGDDNNFDTTPYIIISPDNFPQMLIPEDNLLTQEGVQ